MIYTSMPLSTTIIIHSLRRLGSWLIIAGAVSSLYHEAPWFIIWSLSATGGIVFLTSYFHKYLATIMVLLLIYSIATTPFLVNLSTPDNIHKAIALTAIISIVLLMIMTILTWLCYFNNSRKHSNNHLSKL